MLNDSFYNNTKFKFQYLNNPTQNFDLKDILICTAEYSDEENLFYIAVTRPGINNYQYIIKSNEQNYIVNFTTVLNNSTNLYI